MTSTAFSYTLCQKTKRRQKEKYTLVCDYSCINAFLSIQYVYISKIKLHEWYTRNQNEIAENDKEIVEKLILVTT